MQPLLLIPLGLALLPLFCFGGRVQGGGERIYVASAARAFLLPWLLICAANLWVRWGQGHAMATDALWSVPGAVIPIIAAFLTWRHFRNR